MTRWLVPLLRRTLQALSVFVMVMLPLLALYSHYKEARAIADLPADQWQSKAVRTIDKLVGDDETLVEAIANTQGTVWSARILGVSVTDPLAGLEAIASSRTVYIPLLWSLLIPLALTLLLGRVFCGWICPMNTLLELVDKGRFVLRWLEIRERDVRFSLSNKYFVLVLALGFVVVTGNPFLAMIYPPAALSREMHVLVFASSVGVGIYFILAICAFELFVSKRWWCRYICPGGAVYSWLGRFRAIRVRRDAEKCTQCGDCVRVCQFDLRPMLVRTTGMECTNCAACIAGCEHDALSYRVVLPMIPERGQSGGAARKESRQAAKSATAPVGEGDATGSSSGSLRAPTWLFWLALYTLCSPATAHAHHILGLPHYSYKENYPQAPTLEYPATTGPYDVLMTTYPGKPVPGEAATIAFYIRDRTTGQPYAQAVTLRVLKTATFAANEVIHRPATHMPFDNQHKYTILFPEHHEYIVELTMEVEGQDEVIPFLVVAGEPTATKSVVITILGGLLVFLLVVRALKLKRERQKRREAVPSISSVNEPQPTE